MTDYMIMTDEAGGTVRLTTNSPVSSYRIPVLQITADDIDDDF